MRVLLDENVDGRIKPPFAEGLEVLTVAELGWDSLKNGALLAAASAEFDAMVTMDRSIPHQQNLKDIDLGILIIRVIADSVAGSRCRPDLPTHPEEKGNVILSAAASPIQTRTSAGRRPKDLESALGPRRPERAP